MQPTKLQVLENSIVYEISLSLLYVLLEINDSSQETDIKNIELPNRFGKSCAISQNLEESWMYWW